MGAWVMTLGLRAAVETDWRRQINKPDPVIPMGQQISSASAGAKSENEVSLAGAKYARRAPVAVAPAASLWSPSRALSGAAGAWQAEPRRHSWLGPPDESTGGIGEPSGVCSGISEKPPGPARARDREQSGERLEPPQGTKAILKIKSSKHST